MATFYNLPSVFVPLVGLVFPTITMVYLSLRVHKHSI